MRNYALTLKRAANRKRERKREAERERERERGLVWGGLNLRRNSAFIRRHLDQRPSSPSAAGSCCVLQASSSRSLPPHPPRPNERSSRHLHSLPPPPVPPRPCAVLPRRGEFPWKRAA